MLQILGFIEKMGGGNKIMISSLSNLAISQNIDNYTRQVRYIEYLVSHKDNKK